MMMLVTVLAFVALAILVWKLWKPVVSPPSARSAAPSFCAAVEATKTTTRRRGAEGFVRLDTK